MHPEARYGTIRITSVTKWSNSTRKREKNTHNKHERRLVKNWLANTARMSFDDY